MARTRKNQKGDPWVALACFGLLILVLVLTTAAVMTPLILWLAWLINRSDLRKFAYQRQRFAQTAPKKGDVSKRERHIKIYNQLLKRIEQEGLGIPRRKDGLFSERSELGKLLNEKLLKIYQQIENEQLVSEHVQDNPQGQSYELERLNKVNSLISYSTYSWLISAMLIYWAGKPVALAFIGAGALSGVFYIIGLWLYVPTREAEQIPERQSEIHL